MRDPFHSFCDALFTNPTRRRDFFFGALKVFEPKADVGSGYSIEEKVAAVRSLPRDTFLKLLYRTQFDHPPNVFQALAQYKNAHPDREQFVNEFLQNADDASSTHVTFEFKAREIVVRNDGHGFTHENLHAICSFHDSEKQLATGRQIGRFGMGFKTVFRVSPHPEVHTFDRASGVRVAFRFFEPGGLDRELFEDIKKKAPLDYSSHIGEADRAEHHLRVGYILPEPIPYDEDLADPRGNGVRKHGTCFRLPLRDGEVAQKLQKGGLESVVNPDTFLFLRNVRTLDLVDKSAAQTRSVRYSKQAVEPVATLDCGALEALTISTDDPRFPTRRWLVLRARPRSVDPNTFGDLDPWVRKLLPPNLVFGLAVPVTDRDHVDLLSRGDDPGGRVYAFLPVKNVAVGLNLHVDAPFNLTDNRADLADDQFNRALIAYAAEGVRALLRFIANSGRVSWRDSLNRLIPDRAPPALGITEPISAAALDFRAHHPFVPTGGGALSRPSDVLFLEQRECFASAARFFSKVPRSAVLPRPEAPEGGTDVVFASPDDPETRHLANLRNAVGGKLLTLEVVNTALSDAALVRAFADQGGNWLDDVLEIVRLIAASDGQVRDLRARQFLRTAAPDGRMTSLEHATIFDGSSEDLTLVAAAFPERAPLDPTVAAALERAGALPGGNRLHVSDKKRGLKDLRLATMQALDGPPNPALLRLLARLRAAGVLGAEDRAPRALKVQSVLLATGETSYEPLDRCAPAASDAVHAELLPHLRHAALDGAPTEVAEMIRAWLPTRVSRECLREALLRVERPSVGLVQWVLFDWAENEPRAKRGHSVPVSAPLQSALALKVAGKDAWRPASELAIRAFPEGCAQAELAALLPELEGIDLHHYAATDEGTGAWGDRLRQVLDVVPVFEPTPEQLLGAAARVTTPGQSWAFLAYISRLGVDLDRHLASGRRMELIRGLAHLEWLPARDGRRAGSGDLLLVDPRQPLGRAMYGARLRCLDFGDDPELWASRLEGVVALQRAGWITLRPTPSPAELGAARDVVLRELARSNEPLRVRRTAWESFGAIVAAAGEAAPPELTPSVPFVTAELEELVLEEVGRRASRPVVVSDSSTAAIVRDELGDQVRVVVEADPSLRAVLVRVFGVTNVDRERLIADGDLARRVILALATKTAGERLQRLQVQRVLEAYRWIAKSADAEIDPSLPVVLTANDTLEHASHIIYAGLNPIVERVLSTRPDRKRHLFHPDVRANDLLRRALGVRDDSSAAASPHVSETLDAAEIEEEQEVSDADLYAVISERMDARLRPRMPPDLTNATVRWTREPVKVTWSVEAGGDRYSSSDAFGVFATREGDRLVVYADRKLREEWKQRLLEREDAARARHEQELRQRFASETEAPRKEIERLLRGNVRSLAHSYDLTVRDEDIAEALERDRPDELRRLLGKASRKEELRKRNTTDRGYTLETVMRELIQNAEDAYTTAPRSVEKPFVRVRLTQAAIELRHAGRRFSEAKNDGERPNDLMSICSLGASRKDAVEIGRFGLGFKSVFAVTERVTVRSHPYHFHLESLILPEWDEGAFEEVMKRQEETVFIIHRPAPGKLADAFDELARRVRDGEDFHVTQIPFLRRIDTLEVFEEERSIRKLERAEAPAPTWPLPKEVAASEIEVREAGGAAHRFLLVRKPVTISFAGEGKRRVEVAVALPIAAGAQRFTKLPADPAWRRTYLHLPTAESHALPFLVHAAWATEAGRNALPTARPTYDCNWDLGRAMAGLFRELLHALLRAWRGEPAKLASLYDILPGPANEVSSPHPLGAVHDVIQEMIDEGEELFLTRSDKLVSRRALVAGSKYMVGLHDALVREDRAAAAHFPAEAARVFVDAWVKKAAAVWDYPAFVSHLDRVTPRALWPKRLAAIAKYHDEVRETARDRPILENERSALARALREIEVVPTRDGSVGRADEVYLPGDAERLLSEDRIVDLSRIPVASARWFIEEVLGVPTDLRPDDLEDLAEGCASHARALEILQYAGRSDEAVSSYRVRKTALRALVTRWAVRPDELRNRVPASFLVDLFTELESKIDADDPEDRAFTRGLDLEAARKHNVEALVAWWHRQTARPGGYDLIGAFGGLLGLGPNPARDALRAALLAEDRAVRDRTWFRVVSCANIAQSPMRLTEGVRFLEHFEKQGYFDRFWDARTSDFEEIVQAALAQYFGDREGSVRQWTAYWRRLYDFQKIKHLIRQHAMVDSILEVASSRPRDIIDLLHAGKLPGERRSAGFGESLKSQCFFLVRELKRLGVFDSPDLDVACYSPNRHVRWVAYCLNLTDATRGPPDEQMTWEQMFLFSEELARLFAPHAHFGGDYDIPLLHYASERCSFWRGCGDCSLACERNEDPTVVERFRRRR